MASVPPAGVAAGLARRFWAARRTTFVTKLDGTSLSEARAAAQAAVDRFGRIDVLINNAGHFYAGFFEARRPLPPGRSGPARTRGGCFAAPRARIHPALFTYRRKCGT
ncbi:SDR family NAD(P)-dependent oxidoreductase [Streptomyces iakyrus]|uniref:SDR family NAD(P)-dependent oxidoreductase n=1 Tax=Streptomyces iakyrus TaxID=68219 RepID=UPI0009960B35